MPPTPTRPTQCLAITIPWNRVACPPWDWFPVVGRGWCASEYGGQADPSSTPVVVSHKWFFWVFPSLSAWPACPRSIFYPLPSFPAEVALEDIGSGLSSAPALFGEQGRPDTRAQTFFHSPGPDCMSLIMPQIPLPASAPYRVLFSATVMG